MKSILKYILFTSFKDKIYYGIFVSLILCFAFANFIGDIAIVEKIKTNIVYFAGYSRIIVIFGIILLVAIYMNRAFYNKEVEFILSKNISRSSFILFYLIAFFVIFIITSLPILAILLIINDYKIANLYWYLTLLFEGFIVINFTLLASLILNSTSVSIISAFAFYIISRVFSTVTIVTKLPENISSITDFFDFTKIILKLLSFLFPRLDLFGKTSYLIYEIDYNNLYIIITQTIIFSLVMIFMSFYDFNKKQF